MSLSRARERLISARAVLSSARYRTVLAALASPGLHRVRRRKICAAILVALTGRGIALFVVLTTQPAVFFGFFLAPTVPLRRLSSVSDTSLSPPHEEHPVPSQSLLLQTRNAVDSLAPPRCSTALCVRPHAFSSLFLVIVASFSSP